MTRKPADIVSTQIRIPSPLHRKTAKAAEQNRRSLNEEIVWRLEQSFKTEHDDVAKDIAELKERQARQDEILNQMTMKDGRTVAEWMKDRKP